MTKANFTLPNGTTIEIDGSLEEIQKLADHVGRQTSGPPLQPAARSPAPSQTPRAAAEGLEGDEEPDIAHIASIIKDCNEAEQIAVRVLDQNDMLNKVLMCLWAVYRYVNPNMGLTSGNVEKITDQLGVRISTANASKTLSGRANPFVSGDSVRKKGSPVRYRINRRGMQVFEALLAGQN